MEKDALVAPLLGLAKGEQRRGPSAWRRALLGAVFATVAVLLLAAGIQSGHEGGRLAALRLHATKAVTSAYGIDGAAAAGIAPLPPEVLRHFVATTPTADFRQGLVKSMRGWRRGIRTLVLTNATGQALAQEQAEGRRFNERWAFYPDHPGFPVTGKPGDPRAAMAPLLAATQLGGEFKWLLYGDDDVAFLWPGILRALQGLDPSDPYFITDNYYSRWPVKNTGPCKLDQPRCVPCTLNTSGIDLKAVHALKTCSCTVAAMTEEFAELLTGKNQFSNFPRRPPITTVAGSGGAILSIGLLRRLNVSLYESCITGKERRTGGPTVCGGEGGAPSGTRELACLPDFTEFSVVSTAPAAAAALRQSVLVQLFKQWRHGPSDCGDGLLTKCLWHQGYGYTDPGTELRHRGMLLFNGFRNNWQQMHRSARDALLVGGCLGECQLRLDTAVSVHTNGRYMHMGNYSESGAQVAAFLGTMAAFAAAHASLQQLASSLVV